MKPINQFSVSERERETMIILLRRTWGEGVGGREVVLIFVSFEHKTMRWWEGHVVRKYHACPSLCGCFPPIYGAVGYGLALTLMVMTGLSERGGDGCRDWSKTAIFRLREREGATRGANCVIYRRSELSWAQPLFSLSLPLSILWNAYKLINAWRKDKLNSR